MGENEKMFHGKDNEKYISPDGHHELVRNPEDKIPLTEKNDPKHMGTYNVFNTRGNIAERFGHGIVDIFPYIFFGNAPNDSTNILGRVFMPITYKLENWRARQ